MYRALQEYRYSGTIVQFYGQWQFKISKLEYRYKVYTVSIAPKSKMKAVSRTIISFENIAINITIKLKNTSVFCTTKFSAFT